MPIAALSAGTGRPACASTANSAFCRRKVDFAGHVRPGQQQHAPIGREVAVVRHERAWPASAASTTGCRPASTQERVVIGDHRPAPGAALGQFRSGLQHIQQRQRLGAGGQRVGLGQHGCDQMREDRALARRGPLAGLADAPVEVGQFRRGEAGAVRHALAQRQFRERAQLLHGGGRRLDDVAELRVVADLQAGDAVALRDSRAAAWRAPGGCRRAARARASSSPSKPGRIAPPSSSRAAPGRPAPRPVCVQGSIDVQRAEGARRSAGASDAGSGCTSQRRSLRRCGRARREQSVAHGGRGRAGRRGSSDSRPSARAMSGAPRSAARNAVGGVGFGEQPGPAHPAAPRSRPDRSAGRRARRPAGARPPASACAAPRRAACASTPPSRARWISRLARVAASIASSPACPAASGRARRGSAPACVART